MKITITGHTQGIGKAIADSLAIDGHDIQGFSLDVGHDLTDDASRSRMLAQSLGSDIFINNAFTSTARPQKTNSWIPIEMLYQLHRAWRGDASKTIMTVGSSVQNADLDRDYPYQVHKMTMRLACQQLRTVARYPRIIMVSPGATKTDMLRYNNYENYEKMEVDDVAYMIKFCLDNLDRIYVNEIIFTPGNRYDQNESAMP